MWVYVYIDMTTLPSLSGVGHGVPYTMGQQALLYYVHVDLHVCTDVWFSSLWGILTHTSTYLLLSGVYSQSQAYTN